MSRSAHAGSRTGPDRDRPDRPSAERARQAADVIGVQVAEQHEGDAAHPEAREAGVDRPVGRTGVDQHHPARTRRGQHDGVALPDVARHDHPPRGRPARRDEPGRDDHHRGAREHGEQHGAATAGAGHHRDAAEHRRPSAAPPPGPRARAARHRAPRRRDRPPRSATRQAIRPARRTRPPRRARPERRSAASTPSTVAGATAGAASRLATTATGLTSPPNPATSGAVTRKAAAGTASASAASRGTPRAVSARRPPRRQEHERGGGRHRQREPGVDGERGIGEQQHQHGGGERGQRGSRPAHAQRHQRDRSHHRRPHHARRWPGEHHEAHEDRARHGRRQPRIGPQPPQAREHGTGQDRQIGPGHREQMGEPGGAEVVVHLGGERAGVADGQPGQQPGLGGRSVPVGGPADPTAARRPRTATTAERRPRAVRHAPAAPRREVGRARRGEQALRRDALPGQQPAPALGGREQQHPAAGRPAPRACGGRHQLGGHDHPGCGRPPGCARRAQRAGIVAQDDPQGRRRAPERRARAAGCAATSRVWAAMTIPAAAAVPAAASSDRRPAPRQASDGGRARDQRDRAPARPSPIPSSITAQAAAAAGTSRRSGGAGRSVGGARIRPSPARGAAGTAAHRCRRSPAAAPPGRSGRCGCATPRCAGR